MDTAWQMVTRLPRYFAGCLVLSGKVSALFKNFTATGKVFNRDEILQELRGIDCDAFNRSVDITMSRLRQKLKDDPKSPRFIKTVWGTGYAFIGSQVTDWWVGLNA